jgi:signal transduction histidine kinase
MAVKNRGKPDLGLHLLALYLLFVVPIFVLALFFYVSASQRLREDVIAADLSLARAIALETNEVLLKAKAAVTAFAEMPAVIRADPAGMEHIFAAGAAARQDINLFYRLSTEGIMLYHYPPAPNSTVGQDFSFRDYFQAAIATQGPVFSRGRTSPTTGRPVVTSVMPVYKQGRFDGVVATNLDLQRLTETLRQIGQTHPHSNEVKIIMVDAVGQVIAHSDMSDILENVSATLPGVGPVLAGHEGSLEAKDSKGTEWLYSYTPIPGAGWGVIVQRPTQLAFASLISFQRGLVLALGLFGLGALFFWTVLSRWVITPLEKLTDYGESVGRQTVESEPNRKMVLPLARRPDQIGRLTHALLNADHHIHQRLVELTTLNKTSAAVVSTLDTQKVIDTILDEVQRLLQVRQCALRVMNETTRQLEMRASRGLSQNYAVPLDLTEATQKLPTYQAIMSKRPVQVSDIEQEADFAPILPLARAEGYRSCLAIPLTALHVPPAALVIYRADIHQFTEQEIDLVTSFANQAAIALEHATLFSLTDAELQKQVRFLSALNRVARTVNQSLLIEEVLQNAMEAALEVIEVDACWMYLQREMEEFLRLRAQRGLPLKLAEHGAIQIVEFGKGLIGQVAQQSQPFLLDAKQIQSRDWTDEPIMTQANWQSLALAPLVAKGITFGVLGVASHQNQAFAEAEADLLQAIGDQIAIAVVNARLYRRNREVAILEERNRVAREIHDTLAQGFAGILVQLQAAERLSLKNPEKAQHSLQEAQDLARESLQEARRSVLNLRPTVLENLPLDQAIAKQVQRFGSEYRLKVNFILEGYPSPLNSEVAQHLYRVTQEALTNVGRHAQAKNVTVTLSFSPQAVTLTITDDGIGLNGQMANAAQITGNGSIPKQGFGLVSMQQRAGLMQGQVTFETPETGGTQIKVVIPR